MGGSPSKSTYKTQPGGWLSTRTPDNTEEPTTETQGTKETAALPPRNVKNKKRSLYSLEPGYPSPVPPPNNLPGILSVTDFTVPNAIAKEVTADSCSTMEELVEELTGSFNMDILKVRAIFMWVGSQPFTVQQYPEDADPESPTGYLRRMALGKMSYAEIFTVMCRLAKVPCVMILGVAKSSAYEVGDANVDKLRNVWNAVYVAGGWRIVFLLWAFRSIAGKSTGVAPLSDPTSEDYKNQEKMLKEKILSTVKEYYFLTSPEEFIYRCLPDEEKWQMSYKKYTKAKFIKIPYCRPRFFELSLQLSSSPEGVLTTDNGVCDVLLRYGDGPITLVHDLLYNERQSKQKLPPGVQLPRYCVSINEGDKVRFSMRFPFKGVYQLQILDEKYEWLCSFKIICKTAKQLCEPFPGVSYIGFGPCRATLDAKLTAESHKEGVVKVIEKKEIEMLFSVPQNVTVKAVLSSAMSPEKAIKGAVTQRVQFESLTIKVTTPHRGDFCLKLLTKGKNASNRYKVVCNYLLTSDEFNSKKKPRTYENAEEKNARTRLFAALIKGDNPDELQEAIDKFNVLNLPDDGEIAKAKTQVLYLKTMKDFKEGLSRRSLPILEKALDNSNNLPKSDEMKPLIRQSSKMVKNLRTLKKHSHDVLALSSRTISEYHRYKDPVPVMVDIMRATYLLLGEEEAALEEWEHIQTIMRKTGRDSLSVRVRMFDVTKVNITLAKKVLKILQQYDKDTAVGASAGAGTFYLWASGIARDIISEESTTVTDNSPTPVIIPNIPPNSTTPRGMESDRQRDTPREISHVSSRDTTHDQNVKETSITARTDSVSTCLSVICV